MRPGPDSPVSVLPNLGPVTARLLGEVGIATVGDLEALGAVEAYARLRFRHGRAVTRIALHALEAGLRGIDWRALTPADKAALEAAAAARLKAVEGPASGARPPGRRRRP